MKNTYKAVQVTRPGLVETVEKELPEPGPGEVLIKVEACGICGADAGVIEGLENGYPVMRWWARCTKQPSHCQHGLSQDSV